MTVNIEWVHVLAARVEIELNLDSPGLNNFKYFQILHHIGWWD